MNRQARLWTWHYRLPPRLMFLMAVPVVLVVVGTIGYCAIERVGALDAMYMTVCTLSTIGFADVQPKTDWGKLLTIILILVGVFTFLYTATEMIRTVVSGEVAEMVGKQQRERAVTEIDKHIIVCGYGRMGKLVCQEL